MNKDADRGNRASCPPLIREVFADGVHSLMVALQACRSWVTLLVGQGKACHGSRGKSAEPPPESRQPPRPAWRTPSTPTSGRAPITPSVVADYWLGGVQANRVQRPRSLRGHVDDAFDAFRRSGTAA